MTTERLGEFNCNGVPIFIEEALVDTLNLKPHDDFKVCLGIQDSLTEMGLSDIQLLKRLLCAAEKRVRLRQEQALRARNLKLDL